MAYGKWLTTNSLVEGRKDGSFPFWNHYDTKKIMVILLIIQEKSVWNTGKLNITVYEENMQCSSIIFFQKHKTS